MQKRPAFRIAFSRLFLISILLPLLSCANLSKNTIYQGTFVILNGQFQDKSWDEKWVFKRSSWYFELTMYFEVFVGQLAEQSSFNNWLSDLERALLSQCNEKYVVMSYALDPDRISERSFMIQMEKLGMSQIILPDFSKQVRMHPDFERLGLREHNVYFLCRKGPGSGQELKASFHSFKDAIIN